MRPVLRSSRSFFKHFFAYLWVTLLSTSVVSMILVPIFNWLAASVLTLGGVAYVSYTNVGQIVTHHPLVVFALLLIFLCLMLAVFIEFTFVLLGVYYYHHDMKITLSQLTRLTFRKLKEVSVPELLFYIFYFMLIIPVSGILFHSPLLAKVRIPEFIIDYIFADHYGLMAALLIGIILVLFFAIRWIFVLPIMIINNENVRPALRKSWGLTKIRHFWGLVYRAILVTVVSVGLTGLSFAAIFFAQDWVDKNWPDEAFAIAMGGLFLLEFCSFMFTMFASIVILDVFLQPLTTNQIIAKPLSPAEIGVHINQKNPARSSRTLRIFVGILMTTSVSSIAAYNIAYLAGLEINAPQTLSHRGVDEENGVQNTIPALEKTAKIKPKYVEMDIQETKDQQFVVMHDENLKALTGVNQAPQDLTLAELTKLTARENGLAAPVVSFDDYLAKAEALNQKLLVEIKVSKKDSPNLVKNFVKRYGADLIKHHDLMHTLDYNTVQAVKTALPDLKSGYILPYNFAGLPITKADFFTMEFSTLNETFVSRAHGVNKQVFAWTVNEVDDMDRMMFLDVDGIITDDLSGLKSEVYDFMHARSYAQRLLNYMVDLENQ